jgi:septal ring factor EnvC (AmiA/AmiB activator)
MLLADAIPSAAPANTIGMAVIAGSLLLSAFSGVLAMFFTRREHIAHKEEVNRRLTAMENQFATVHSEIRTTREEIHDAERRLAEAGEHRAEALHIRFNDVLSRISEVRGELNANRPH